MLGTSSVADWNLAWQSEFPSFVTLIVWGRIRRNFEPKNHVSADGNPKST